MNSSVLVKGRSNSDNSVSGATSPKTIFRIEEKAHEAVEIGAQSEVLPASQQSLATGQRFSLEDLSNGTWIWELIFQTNRRHTL